MKQKAYVALVLLSAAVLVAFEEGSWHGHWAAAEGGVLAVLWLTTAAALVFPITLSPQASASLAGAPILASVLLLSPLQAFLAVTAGTLLAELRLRRKPIVVLFNVGKAGLEVCLASLAVRTLSGAPGPFPGAFPGLDAAVLAGLTLWASNLALVGGIVSIVQGVAFWRVWSKVWRMDAVQELGALAIGYLAAYLIWNDWWRAAFLAVPVLLAYFALKRSASEARSNVELTGSLQAQMQELKATQAQLIESAKLASVGTLAAGVAHEINNPIFVVQAKTEMLLLDADRHLATAQAREDIQVVHEMSKRASKIVRELLGYARKDDRPGHVHLTKVIDGVLELVGDQLRDRGIAVRKDFSPVPPVVAPPGRLQQVFLNLVLNARDAMPQGGALAFRCWAEDGVVKAAVKDTGSGIPAEVRARLFEPFVTTKPPGAGSGLGLFMCRRIVTEHNGRIAVNTEAGSGTEVIVELPAAEARVPAAAH